MLILLCQSNVGIVAFAKCFAFCTARTAPCEVECRGGDASSLCRLYHVSLLCSPVSRVRSVVTIYGRFWTVERLNWKSCAYHSSSIITFFISAIFQQISHVISAVLHTHDLRYVLFWGMKKFVMWRTIRVARIVSKTSSVQRVGNGEPYSSGLYLGDIYTALGIPVTQPPSLRIVCRGLVSLSFSLYKGGICGNIEFVSFSHDGAR